jgi:plastocyanin
MRHRPYLILLAALAALSLAAAGCGDDEETTTEEPAVTSEETGAANEETDGGGGAAKPVEVAMTEYRFDPSDLALAQGDSIEVVNDGELPHNFTVEAEDLATPDIDPGASDELTVDLAPGEYEFICTIADHAADGMTGTLTVE